ncbi:ABC transporter substrate-binding protein [Clostridium swellfunianum]|uniref:ABC transporter substrate-binding protein n=1 Tax=Clostridium swellfunianum TaxID=1367462 RepID=UPI00202E16D7|nr:ABC transporter substrate-binding protein [Clostridium swellfunianum]MCM0650718.1 ABC transporter substrate-binding protein [Clostridium swellfunianum]
MFFKRKRLEEPELALTNTFEKTVRPKGINRQVYQNIVAKRVSSEAEEALEVTEILIRSVEDINMEMEKHSEHILKTVDVSSEVGAFSEEVNAGADETMKVIEDTLNRAKIGQVSVNNVISSIETVQNTVENMKGTIIELAEKSNKIKVILDTIKGIAKTTHLLSLNANIEAARAGEAGRGFAVVAGEVKKLAENSSKSADEIDRIVTEITEVTEDTLNIIMDGTEKVLESTTIAENAGRAINDMMESVERTKIISNQISGAVKQQVDKNQNLISVIDEMVQVSEKVRAFNENISVNADRQKAALNNLKQTITNLNMLSEIERLDKDIQKTSFTMAAAALKALDPAMATEINDSNVLTAINLGLVQFGPGTEVISAIAKTWHIESDNLTWNFNLRKNMKFHNGRNITARDVKYTFERLLSKKLDSPNRWFLSMVRGAEEFYSEKTNEVAGIIVNGDYNLKIVLKYPYSSFINNLAHCSCSILPKEEFNNLQLKPVGAGPYKFADWDKATNEIILEKFDGFDLGEALVNSIRIICDIEDTFEQFEKGNLDYITVNASNIDRIREKNYKTDLSQCIGLRFIAFNYRSNNPIIKNKFARQAINCCVDKDRIIKEALGGFEIVSKGVFPASILNNPSLITYGRNLSKAKELIRKSGISSGTLTLQISSNGGNTGFHSRLAVVLKENLKEIGIELRTMEVNGAKYYDEESFRKSDLFTYGWLGDSGTADNFIEPLIDINNSSNRSRYNNPELMKLIDKAKKTKNPYKYRELLCKLENIVMEDAAWVPLSNICVSYAYRDSVKGLKVHPLNIINFADIWKEE